MRTLDFKLNIYRTQMRRLSVRGFILLFAASFFLSGIPLPLAALDEGILPKVETVDRQITWTAGKTSLDPTKSLVELTGNVKIVQGETVINADNAQIFFKKNEATEQGLKSDSFEKFIASGNVRIESEFGVATSISAIYITGTKILRLLGKPAKFIRGDNVISGRIITVNRETGNVTIEGDTEAVIYSEDTL